MMFEVTFPGDSALDALAAWSAFAAAVGTAAIVGLGFGQLRGLRRQLTDAHRPVLGVQGLLVATDGRVQVRLINAGVGPALNVEIALWMVPVGEIPETPESIAATVEGTAPHYTWSPGGAIPAGQNPQRLDWLAVGDPEGRWLGTYGTVVVLRLTYRDIYGNDRSGEPPLLLPFFKPLDELQV